MKKKFILFVLAGLACFSSVLAQIPLPEHPRPDFERSDFINLNGYWYFTFDSLLAQKALAGNNPACMDKRILVPFPWGAPLSEVKDEGDVAWYGRSLKVPESWKGKRIFLVVGASDWETEAWLDGKALGRHRGGYVPFEFELTENVRYGEGQQLYFRVDDTYAPWHLYGKQGYGNARGIWQTVYLEARGENFIRRLHFTPDIDREKCRVEVLLDRPAARRSVLRLHFAHREYADFDCAADGKDSLVFELPMNGQHLWTLDDPYLYDVTVSLIQGKKTLDAVQSYFGQRKISSMFLPGKKYQYVALNNRPLYLQLCLDQSYHPEGYYCFPSDECMKNEILISKRLGLNGNRVHIKTEIPRKLYWADRLGLLIMSDVPNWWGDDCPEARREWEKCMRAQLARDYNHPCIFAWVDFNETWGLFTKVDGQKTYLPETQEWVRSMYRLTKRLDPSRLVEDNSPCNHDHVETDINSWHSYQPGHRWEYIVNEYDSLMQPGDTYNFIGKNRVGHEPMMNSECGNVWGYKGSAGNSDYTWDYHEMMNAFHRHPRVCGWLYTEHHDVINEWNGYVRYDRSPKIDGLDALFPGMSLRDFHSPYYLVSNGRLCRDVSGGSVQDVVIQSSFTTDADPGRLSLETRLVGWNALGEYAEYGETERSEVVFIAFDTATVAVRRVEIPRQNGLYILQMSLRNGKGEVLHRNFCLFAVKDGEMPAGSLRFAPKDFTCSHWSLKQNGIYGGLKVNGFGSGYFEYEVIVPDTLDVHRLKGAHLLFEASAKQLFSKDVDSSVLNSDISFMLGKGTHDPCKSLNSYAMTDTVCWTSEVIVSVNGKEVEKRVLPDDPADHRGMLSWHAQPAERQMREAGSYGYLLNVRFPLEEIRPGKPLRIRFSVPESAVSSRSGGLAIYGRDFGRYPLDPTIVWEY